MSKGFDLDSLAEELEPVKPLNANGAIGTMVLLTVIGAVFVVSTLGFRDQFLGSTATDPMFLIRSGLLVVLAAASLSAATSMARPAVGTSRSGWRWAAMAALIVPIAAAIAALVSRTPVAERLHPVNGVECLTYSISIGLDSGRCSHLVAAARCADFAGTCRYGDRPCRREPRRPRLFDALPA